MSEPENREKVIKGLEWALENMVDPSNDFRFAGYDGPIVLLNEPIVRDALALLKAQEPVEPTLRGGIGGYWYCGACNYQISRGDKFCRYCGQEVKWG